MKNKQFQAKFRCLAVCHSLCPLRRQGKCSLWQSAFQQLNVTEFVRSQMKPAASVSAAPARCSPFPTGNSISFFRSNLNIIETCFKLHLVLKVSDGDSTLTILFSLPSLMNHHQSWFRIKSISNKNSSSEICIPIKWSERSFGRISSSEFSAVLWSPVQSCEVLWSQTSLLSIDSLSSVTHRCIYRRSCSRAGSNRLHFELYMSYSSGPVGTCHSRSMSRLWISINHNRIIESYDHMIWWIIRKQKSWWSTVDVHALRIQKPSNQTNIQTARSSIGNRLGN